MTSSAPSVGELHRGPRGPGHLSTWAVGVKLGLTFTAVFGVPGPCATRSCSA